MLNLWKYAFLAILLLACEDPFTWKPCNTPLERLEPYPVSVDTMCSMREKEVALDAIDNINEMANSLVCQPILKFAGYTEIDHTSIELPGNGELVCYREEPAWFKGTIFEPKLGWGRYTKWVRLFLFKDLTMPENLLLAITTHELLHYIGLDHSKNSSALMYPYTDGLTTTPRKSDGKLFCDVYNCVD